VSVQLEPPEELNGFRILAVQESGAENTMLALMQREAPGLGP
jgi:hypothetical protein